MTNWPRREERLYELRPCHSINLGTHSTAGQASVVASERPAHRETKLNCVIEKSAASDACLPSLPTMPTPTSAARIIATSLPPSPIAAVRFFVYCAKQVVLKDGEKVAHGLHEVDDLCFLLRRTPTADDRRRLARELQELALETLQHDLSTTRPTSSEAERSRL